MNTGFTIFLFNLLPRSHAFPSIRFFQPPIHILNKYNVSLCYCASVSRCHCSMTLKSDKALIAFISLTFYQVHIVIIIVSIT